MEKRALTILVTCLIIFSAGIASAYETEIQIKTAPFHEVQLTILDAAYDEFMALDSFKGTSNFFGDITFNYESDEAVFDIMVVIKDETGETVHREKFREGYVAEESIYIEVAPKGTELIYMPEENETGAEEIPNDTIVLTNESGEESNESLEASIEEEPKNRTFLKGILGFATSEEGEEKKGFFQLKTVFYFLGIILLATGSLFGVRFLRKRKSSGPKEIKVKKMSDVNKEEPKTESSENKPLNPVMNGGDVSSRISAAEQRIKEAQDELNSLKKEERAKEIRERILKDQEELKRLGQQ